MQLLLLLLLLLLPFLLFIQVDCRLHHRDLPSLLYSDPDTFVGQDPDPGFDEDDELVFMFRYTTLLSYYFLANSCLYPAILLLLSCYHLAMFLLLPLLLSCYPTSTLLSPRDAGTERWPDDGEYPEGAIPGSVRELVLTDSLAEDPETPVSKNFLDILFPNVISVFVPTPGWLRLHLPRLSWLSGAGGWGEEG